MKKYFLLLALTAGALNAMAQSANQSNFVSTDRFFSATIPPEWLNEYMDRKGYLLTRMKHPIGQLLLKSYKRFEDSTAAIQFIADRTDGHGGIKVSYINEKEFTRFNFFTQIDGNEARTIVTIVRRANKIVVAYYTAPRVVTQTRYWQTEINEVEFIIAGIDFPDN